MRRKPDDLGKTRAYQGGHPTIEYATTGKMQVKHGPFEKRKRHDAIRHWAESRGAVPSEVASTQTDGKAGILRFQFPRAPHKNDGALKEISWDDFFKKFDESDLSLVYQEKTASGRKSNFNKLVHDESVKSSSSKKHTASTTVHQSRGRSTARKSA